MNWIHHLLNPHCPDCREEREDSKVCASCETLKAQLSLVNFEKDKLLSRLLEKPEPEVQSKSIEMTRPVNVPWNVRRHMLETEDREKARLMRDAPKPGPISTEDLEKEMDIAAESRKVEGK